MNTPLNSLRSAFIVGCLALASIALPARAQSTAFTYQGQLKQGGALAEGLYDIRFKLFNAVSGGTQVGASQCADNITVKDGVFTSMIDFGPQFSSTLDRWLEIEVRKDTGLSCGDTTGYTVLAPRQPVTPTPRATSASVANALAAPDGSPANALIVDNVGNIGIGTATPGFPLHIASTFAAMALQDTGPDSTQAGYISYRNGTGTETAWMGFGSAGDRDFSIVNARSGGDIVLNPFSGNVGIGTATPAARLEVRGDIRLGATGQYFANSTEENLRTLRGTINNLGSKSAGTGWTVFRSSTGTYQITFDTHFTSTPTVVASTEGPGGRATVIAPTTIAVQINAYNSSGALTNDGVYFIATGPR